MSSFPAKPYLLGLSAFLMAFILDFVASVLVALITFFVSDSSAVTDLLAYSELIWLVARSLLTLLIVFILAKKLKIGRASYWKVFLSAVVSLASLTIINLIVIKSLSSSSTDYQKPRLPSDVTVNNINYVFSPDDRVETISQVGHLYSGLDLYVSLEIPEPAKYRLELDVSDEDAFQVSMESSQEYELEVGVSEVEFPIDFVLDSEKLAFREYAPSFEERPSTLNSDPYSTQTVIFVIVSRWGSCEEIKRRNCGTDLKWFPVGGYRQLLDIGLVPYDYEKRSK